MPLLGDMNIFSSLFLEFCLNLCFLLLHVVVKSAPTPPSRTMDLEISGSFEQPEDEEATPPTAAEVQFEVLRNNHL